MSGFDLAALMTETAGVLPTDEAEAERLADRLRAALL